PTPPPPPTTPLFPYTTLFRSYDASELLGRSYLELIRPAARLETRRFYRRQFLERRPNTYYEFPAHGKDGQERWLGQNVQPLWEQDRKSTRLNSSHVAISYAVF